MIDQSENQNSASVKPHVLEILSFIGFAAALVLFLNSARTVLGIPYGLDFGEGYLADMAFKLTGGRNPYHSLDRPPWIVSSYPPLYPFINGLMLQITGPSMIPGRVLSMISLLGMVGTAVAIFRRFKINISIAILVAGLLLCFEWGVRWGQVVRVDTFGVFLTACGIYWWLRSDKPIGTLISALFLTCAVLTKHSLLAAPVAVLLHAFFTNDRRRLPMLAYLVIGIVGSYSLVNFATDGGYFKHLFGYTANAWFIERFTDIILYIKATWLLQIIAFSALLIPGLLKGRKSIFGWYYVLAHGNLLAYGFEGSDTNYFVEPLFATCLIAGFTLDHIASSVQTSANEKSPALPSGRTIAYGVLLAIILLGRFIDPSGYRIHRVGPQQLQNGQTLIGWASAPGLVLSEDASYPFLAGKEVVFQPYIMSLLYRTGKWDQEPFLETIRDQAYSMIILRVDLSDPFSTERRGGAYEMAGFDRWTEEMEEVILDNYFIYNPNPSNSNGAIDVGIWNHWYVYFPKSILDEQ